MLFEWTMQLEEKTKANPKDIWKIWTDIPAWPKWDKHLQWAEMKGPFSNGTTGRLKPKGWLTTTFTLGEIDEGKEFVTKTTMPLTEVVFSHKIESSGKTEARIIYNVTFSGLFTPLLRFTWGPKLKKDLGEALRNLAQQAEKKGAKKEESSPKASLSAPKKAKSPRTTKTAKSPKSVKTAKPAKAKKETVKGVK